MPARPVEIEKIVIFFNGKMKRYITLLEVYVFKFWCMWHLWEWMRSILKEVKVPAVCKTGSYSEFTRLTDSWNYCLIKTFWGVGIGFAHTDFSPEDGHDHSIQCFRKTPLLNICIEHPLYSYRMTDEGTWGNSYELGILLDSAPIKVSESVD